jgi:hypothetical protein
MSTVSIIYTNFDTAKKQNIPGACKTAPLIFNSFMGIDNIQLSPSLIALLYPEILVDTTEEVTGHPPKQVGINPLDPVTIYPFLGGNLRFISFLVGYPDQDFIPDEQLFFLRRMLGACKLSLEDVAIVNTSRTPVRLDILKKQLQPHTIFLWGVPPVSLGVHTGGPEFVITEIDGISVIPVRSPDMMSAESAAGIELKKRLWICLQKLFTL